jgi:pyruvate dehydrogenase E2 component (dihydrolipoamide acetyltransferase)
MATQTTPRLQTFAMPDVGEGLTEAEVLSWLVAVGDTLTVNQVMVEIETAKAAVELPSPFAGRVHELLVEPGVTVGVGTPIITIDTNPDAGELPSSGAPVGNGANGATAPNGAPADGSGGAKIGEVAADGRIATLVGYTSAGAATVRRPRRGAAVPAAADHAGPVAEPAPTAQPAANAPLASPPVRKLAKDLGIDLAAVPAARADGVISRADVEKAAAAGALASHSAVSRRGAANREQRVPVTGIRRATAAAMVASAFTAPHASTSLTVDVTPTTELLEAFRADRALTGHRITLLTMVAKAMTIAVAHNPSLNARWDEAAGEIVQLGFVNLGIAAATPRGLLVPTIKDAGHLRLPDLADAITALTEAARAGTTTPADLSGGTITVTNIGVFGVDTGTPILVPGQAAIVAVGAVRRRPWEHHDEIALRDVMTLSVSFDHRVVDGAEAARFLTDLGAILANPGTVLRMV